MLRGCYLIITLLIFSILTLGSAECNRTCGETRLSYPFGFSDGCPIRLHCTSSNSSGKIKISDLSVQNVTSEQILVYLPTQCNRPIGNLRNLFSTHFAPTWRNGLLLENCSSPINNCAIISRWASTRIGFQQCDSGGRIGDQYNISCYAVGPDEIWSDFLDYGKVTSKGNCSVLLSSIMLDLRENSNSRSIGLDLQMVELGWWVNGDCACDPNANCTEVLYLQQRGYRCTCNQGFVGDGFTAGGGCRKEVSDCSDSSFLPGRCGKNTKVGLLIGGILAGAILMATLMVIYYCVKRRSATLKSRLSAKRLMSEVSGISSLPLYPYREIQRATNGFSEKQRLGTGAYGTVYAGKLHNDEWVAIKKIRYRDRESVEQVMNEIKLLSSVSHPNLVRLVGCCIEDGEQILVYEYMPNGTLSQHLQRERSSVLPWTVRLTIAAETAHAIAYLHSTMNPPIYHRDIKSSNILLDYNFNSKVADFGLSRFGMTDDSHISTAPQGTPGYVDPQYHQNFHLSDKSDVYSFGVVLVEIITAMKVVDFSRPYSEINLAALAVDRIGRGRIDDIVDPFLEPNRDAWTLSSVHKVAELAFRCLAFHRDMRPSMIEVAEELEQIRLSGWAPLEENVHMGSSRASSCSSPYQGSQISLNTLASKKATAPAESSRMLARQRTPPGLQLDTKESSPVSVQDPWSSPKSSPSTSSLLGNVMR